MTKTEANKLIIELEHPVPDEYVNELKIALITAIQNMEPDESTNRRESHETIFTLLELLKHLG